MVCQDCSYLQNNNNLSADLRFLVHQLCAYLSKVGWSPPCTCSTCSATLNSVATLCNNGQTQTCQSDPEKEFSFQAILQAQNNATESVFSEDNSIKETEASINAVISAESVPASAHIDDLTLVKIENCEDIDDTTCFGGATLNDVMPESDIINAGNASLQYQMMQVAGQSSFTGNCTGEPSTSAVVDSPTCSSDIEAFLDNAVDSFCCEGKQGFIRVKRNGVVVRQHSQQAVHETARAYRLPEKFQVKWIRDFPWMRYDKDKNMIFCDYCLRANLNNEFTIGHAYNVKYGWMRQFLSRHSRICDHVAAAKLVEQGKLGKLV